MSSASFRVAFEGLPFVDGEIAVSDLAPALLALGDVVQAANRALNGERAEARLKLRATNVGSFEALLSIDVSMIDAIKDLLDAAVASADRLVAAPLAAPSRQQGEGFSHDWPSRDVARHRHATAARPAGYRPARRASPRSPNRRARAGRAVS